MDLFSGNGSFNLCLADNFRFFFHGLNYQATSGSAIYSGGELPGLDVYCGKGSFKIALAENFRFLSLSPFIA